MPSKKVVVIGGGFGGVAAARVVRSLVDAEHDVVLLDRSRRTYLCGSFPLLIVGEREVSKTSRSLGRLANRGVRFLEAEVLAIDIGSQTVSSSVGEIEYDYLVVALGAAYDWESVPGSAGAYSFYDLENARKLRKRLAGFRAGRVIIAVSSVPYKCPPAPFEAAMVLDWAMKQRKTRRAIDIHVYTPEPAPLPVAGAEAGARIARDLDRKGIELHTDAGVTAVSPDGREAAFSDGSAIDADIVITVPTHRAPAVVAESGLLDGQGWIKVSPSTLKTQHPGVFAVGDVVSIPMANGRPLPKAGVFASAEGEAAGRNIAAAIDGSGPVSFDGQGHCFIAYSGRQGGMVKGEFLAEGGPRVTLQPPSTSGFRAKERFERDWRRFRI